MVASPVEVTEEAMSLVMIKASQALFRSLVFIEEVSAVASTTTTALVPPIRIIAYHWTIGRAAQIF